MMSPDMLATSKKITILLVSCGFRGRRIKGGFITNLGINKFENTLMLIFYHSAFDVDVPSKKKYTYVKYCAGPPHNPFPAFSLLPTERCC